MQTYSGVERRREAGVFATNACGEQAVHLSDVEGIAARTVLRSEVFAPLRASACQVREDVSCEYPVRKPLTLIDRTSPTPPLSTSSFMCMSVGLTRDCSPTT